MRYAILALAALALSSCASEPSFVGDFCGVADPIILRSDEAKRALIERDRLAAIYIKAHNDYGKEHCGWFASPPEYQN